MVLTGWVAGGCIGLDGGPGGCFLKEIYFSVCGDLFVLILLMMRCSFVF